jgi:hypothetical protein
MREAQHALCGDGHVVRADQLPHAGGINSGDGCQVEDDRSRPASKERMDSVPQLARERRTERMIDVEDGHVLRQRRRCGGGRLSGGVELTGSDGGVVHVVHLLLGFLKEFAVLTYSDDDEACENDVRFLPLFVEYLEHRSTRGQSSNGPSASARMTERDTPLMDNASKRDIEQVFGRASRHERGLNGG